MNKITRYTILENKDKDKLVSKINDLMKDSNFGWQPYRDLIITRDETYGRLLYMQVMVGSK